MSSGKAGWSLGEGSLPARLQRWVGAGDERPRPWGHAFAELRSRSIPIMRPFSDFITAGFASMVTSGLPFWIPDLLLKCPLRLLYIGSKNKGHL
jgi:hypothetical protein